MKQIINDPEETEERLLDAGFMIRPVGMAFEVSLANRKASRSEVAAVLGCEEEDLGTTEDGVLVE